MPFHFDNRYARLPGQLFTEEVPNKPSAPKMLAWNQSLATDLGLGDLSPENALQVFSGQARTDGGAYISQAYSGHQFGHWNPQLGDGRAVLIGEQLAPDGQHYDLQLKGSGRTHWSRGGDGMAWIGPVLREYVISEAMHALGVPTTRALSAIATGDMVYRDGPLPGAVLCRVASSHLRVGTFQFAASRGDVDGLSALFDHACTILDPDDATPHELLAHAVQKQAELVAQWMGLGFIHGVMNTDNCHIGGLTIDYGPCAFMDEFHPQKVFSSIDQKGRYAYANQPGMAAWNLAQFATALLPLLPDRDKGIEEFTQIINGFGALFQSAWDRVFATKLGLDDPNAAAALSNDLLQIMADQQAEFTMCFWQLSQGELAKTLGTHPDFATWERDWRAAGGDAARAKNPAFIPRNHLVAGMIDAAVAGDLAPLDALIAAGKSPYTPPDDPNLMQPAAEAERVTATFCGT